MTDAEPNGSEEDVAAAMRRLGDLLITRSLPPEVHADLAVRLQSLEAMVEPFDSQPKEARFGGRNRVHVFLETGEWPPPPPDGEVMDFDIASIVGGDLNPFGLGTVYRRDGDEAVGRVTVPRTFEGPPGRVHGGVICAIFDEVMGSVFRATGTPSAFTGELAVRFEGPAPLGVELEFRAREVRTDGRKRFLEAAGAGPDGRFASATATFIDMRPEHLPRSVL